MTATPILETLAREFSASPEHVQGALEMLDAGLCAPFIGRFRRDRVGTLTETAIRRLDRRRKELEELDRRRATILSIIEREPAADPNVRGAIAGCMDRFELEDLFIPHRRPEPEVQLALDRGLGALADLLVAPVPPEERAALGMTETEKPDEGGDEERTAAPEPPSKNEAAQAEGSTPAEPEPTSGEPEVPPAEPEPTPAEPEAASTEPEAAATEPEPTPTDAEAASDDDDEVHEAAAPRAPIHAIDVKTAMNVHLARLCAPFVNPDRGVHTEGEALSGAIRILSDRLGRNARLRGAVRRILAKHGVLTVRPTVEESRLGRHRSLLRIKATLRQLQGHRLLSIRQAQKERVVHTAIALDPEVALPKVRSALGRHTHPAHEELLREIALQALNQRLIPMVEPDVRLELKERADGEALRFLAQHLRQVLYAPPFGRQSVAGIDVSAKGDFTIAFVGPDGEPDGPELRVEVRGVGGEKAPDLLGAELRAALEPRSIRALAIGHGKGPRAALTKLRAAMRAASEPVRVAPPAAPPIPEAAASGAAVPGPAEGTAAEPATAPAEATPVFEFAGSWEPPPVFLVNEAGLSSYANSELARTELPDRGVPTRMAISLGRRLQDPMAEILKVDPRHLGLGAEQGLVSKANARRVFVETIESATAHVGCDVNTAPLSFLEHVPGLSRDVARKLCERRRERPFQSREELRADGLMTEAQWTGAAAFLRVPGSSESLDATALHPEQYPLVRKILDSTGQTAEQALGRFGVTRGLRREEFEVDDATWRDLMREIAWPGRDPRMRLHLPQLLDPDTDPVRLVRDRVVEGVVSNVASFGIFVDVGLPVDAMVHISEISDRYVRDARELVAIGQVVRARILDAGGQRLTLSLKHVPGPRREPRPGRDGDRGPREFRGRGPGGRRGFGGGPGRGPRGRDRREDRDGSPAAPIRAAQTRRDGLGARSPRQGERRGGGPGRPRGPGRPQGSPRGRGDRRERDAGFGRDERADLESINREKKTFSPFASFFKSRKPSEPGGEETEGADPTPAP